MSAPDALAPIGALAGACVRGAQPVDGQIGVTLRLREGLRLTNLRGSPDALVPATPNTSKATPGGVNLWLGPDEWLHVAEVATAPTSPAWRQAATDVSHGRVVVRIAGPAARDLLATGISVDLRPHAFGPGACLQTSFHRVGVLVHHLDAGAGFDVYFARSYARFAWEMLLESAREFGYEVL